MMNYIVYKLISPSGKVYIGYSKNSLEKRLRVHTYDRKTAIKAGTPLPRFYSAWDKYPIDTWTKEIIESNLSESGAQQLEKTLIEEYQSTNPNFGYNMAEGGNGGNTGRNGEYKKRTEHSERMKAHHKQNPDLASRSSKKGWENSKLTGRYETRCKQIQDRTPTGKEHWMHTGLWVVRHHIYETIEEAAVQEKLNQWTVNEYCNNSSKVFSRDCTLGKKGQTRREAGFYRIPKETV